MPTITLVAVPRPGAEAHLDDITFLLGVPTHVDDSDALERLASLEPLGYRFTSDDTPADSAVIPVLTTDPTAEQAADTPTAQES